MDSEFLPLIESRTFSLILLMIRPRSSSLLFTGPSHYTVNGHHISVTTSHSDLRIITDKFLKFHILWTPTFLCAPFVVNQTSSWTITWHMCDLYRNTPRTFGTRTTVELWTSWEGPEKVDERCAWCGERLVWAKTKKTWLIVLPGQVAACWSNLCLAIIQS